MINEKISTNLRERVGCVRASKAFSPEDAAKRGSAPAETPISELMGDSGAEAPGDLRKFAEYCAWFKAQAEESGEA